MKKLVILLLLLFVNLCPVKAQTGTSSYAYVPDVPDSLIEAQIGSIESQFPLRYTPEVKKYILHYSYKRRQFLTRCMHRSTKYFPLFEYYLDKYGLPKELKYLSILESGLQPHAVSRANAVGLWQFVYLTGKSYNLNSNWYVDERRNPEKSTEAACKFLKYLYDYFNDWELALAAYNTGMGRVRKAIRYAGGKTNFYEIYPYLPRETRGYLPKFVALTYLFEFPETHNLYGYHWEYLPEFDTLMVQDYVHIPTLAEELNLCKDDILKLNPQLKRGVVPPQSQNFSLKIPKDVKPCIIEDRQQIFEKSSVVDREQNIKWALQSGEGILGRERIYYKVRRGDVLGRIAQKYKVRVSQIKKWNNLSNSMIRTGQRLKIWVLPTFSSHSTPTPSKKPSQSQALYVNNGKEIYIVQPGDTLWEIGQKYNLQVKELKKWNNISNHQIHPGQKLIVATQ